jgi:hypothetical protein
MSVSEKKLAQFVHEVDGLIRSDGEPAQRPDAIRRKLSVLVSRCGWRNRTEPRMRLLEARLRERHVYCAPSISNMELPRDAWISLQRDAPALPVQRMPTERVLEEYLANNWRLIKPLSGYGSLDPSKTRVTRQFRLATGECVDLLFEDRSGKRWLVLELKNQSARGAVAQLIGYMNQIVGSGQLPAGFSIEGMIVSPVADPTQISLLQSAVAPGPVQWWQYETELRLVPAPGSVGCDGD